MGGCYICISIFFFLRAWGRSSCLSSFLFVPSVILVFLQSQDLLWTRFSLFVWLPSFSSVPWFDKLLIFPSSMHIPRYVLWLPLTTFWCLFLEIPATLKIIQLVLLIQGFMANRFTGGGTSVWMHNPDVSHLSTIHNPPGIKMIMSNFCLLFYITPLLSDHCRCCFLIGKQSLTFYFCIEVVRYSLKSWHEDTTGNIFSILQLRCACVACGSGWLQGSNLTSGLVLHQHWTITHSWQWSQSHLGLRPLEGRINKVFL